MNVNVGRLTRVVAIRSGGETRPRGFIIVTRLDQRSAPRPRAIHSLARALAHDGWIATFATAHGTIVPVLDQGIRETVANHNRLKIDVGLLVRKDLRGEYGDEVASI